jgi:asparagine synthase (glutamine-hydrolysing)
LSGICGIVRFDDQAVSQSDLERQMGALAMRGPDRTRRWLGDGVGLGALLMSVTREDVFDAQPLHDDARGLSFVCDARLDNRGEIAASLGIDPDALPRMADSAVLFEAYRAWGDGCAERLIGDFTFAAWNADTRTLTLGRDHMGQRHIFFHAGDDVFAFSTDRKGLWALPDVPRRLPRSMIHRVFVRGRLQFRLQAFDPRPAEGISSVPGGTVVTVSPDGAVTARQYWTPQAAPEHLDRDEDYYVETYRRVLAEAVACRVRRATAPVGLMLGGGYDSGAIAALAGPALAPDAKLISVSSVSAANPGGDQDARRWTEIFAAQMPHLDVRYVTGAPTDAMATLERNFYLSDAPHSENRFIGDALFAAAKAAGSRVMMTGDGGDYTLNSRGKGYFIKRLRRWRWDGFVREWRARRRHLGRSHWQMVYSELLLYGAPPFISAWRRWRNGLSPRQSTYPVTDALVAQARAEGVKPYNPPLVLARNPLLNMLQSQQKMHTAGWASTAAAHGMELTLPFHDKRVVELGLAIPEDYFIRNGRERHLARTALKDVYPPEFQTRRDHNDALQPDFMDMAERFTPTILAEIDRMEAAGKVSGYFDLAEMRRMLTRTLPGRPGVRSQSATRNAIHAFIWARYIEWFTGGNG